MVVGDIEDENIPEGWQDDYSEPEIIPDDDVAIDQEVERLRILDEEAQYRAYEEKRQQLIDMAQHISSQDKQDAVRGALETSRYSVCSKWQRLFSQVSFYNEVPGQVLFHCLLGMMLYDQKIRLSGNKVLDWRVHFCLLQDSSSGKGEALRLVLDVFNQLRKLKRDANDEERSFTKYKMSGNITEAKILDGWRAPLTPRAQWTYRAGPLSRHDLVYWLEAKSLIEPGQYNENLQQIMIAVSEPFGTDENAYPRELQDWPSPTYTNSHATVIATTYPLEGITTGVLVTGLPPRYFTYARDVSDALRDKMDKATNASLSSLNIEEYERRVEEIAGELMKIQAFVLKSPPRISPERMDEIATYMISKSAEIRKTITSRFHDRIVKSIISTFAARSRDTIMKLTYHAAAMRFDSDVLKEDVEYAMALFEKSFYPTAYWIEENCLRTRETQQQQKDVSSTLRYILSRHKETGLPRKVVAMRLGSVIHRSVRTGLRIIAEDLKNENSQLIDLGNGNLTLRYS